MRTKSGRVAHAAMANLDSGLAGKGTGTGNEEMGNRNTTGG